LVAVVLGGVFGALSLAAHDAAAGWCNPVTNHCDSQEGANLRAAAIDRGNVSTWSFAGGGVVLAAGAVLWLTAPRSHPNLRLGVQQSTAGSPAFVLDGTF
jgi:hypothetical protein